MQNRYPLLAGFVFMLCLAVAAGDAAVQTSSPATPSQPPAQQPSTPADQAPSSQAQPASPQQGQAHQSPSVDDELKLTSDQKQRIAAVMQDQSKQLGAVQDDNALSADQKQQKTLEIRQVNSTKIRDILTPEQLQKLITIQDKIRQEQRDDKTPEKEQH